MRVLKMASVSTELLCASLIVMGSALAQQSTHAPELARAEDVAGVGKRSHDADGSGLRIHLAVRENHLPFVRVDGAIG